MPWLRLSLSAVLATGLAACAVGEYLGSLRPRVFGQLDAEIATLLNELPNLDEPNEVMIGRLYATGGASRAELGRAGVWRDRIRVPKDELLRTLRSSCTRAALELDITNEDHRPHAMLAVSNAPASL